MTTRFLILDVTEMDVWPVAHIGASACGQTRFDQPVCIPAGSRPTVLQGSRRVAEQEVMRLAERYSASTFALFELTHVSVSVQMATHVNIKGMTLGTRMVQRLMPVRPGDSPGPLVSHAEPTDPDVPF